jgi:plasmid replication initiation protein
MQKQRRLSGKFEINFSKDYGGVVMHDTVKHITRASISKLKTITIIRDAEEIKLLCRDGEVNPNFLVLKENLLINLPVDYSEREQKLIALVVSQIREFDESLSAVKFTMDQLAEHLGVKKAGLFEDMQAITKTINRSVWLPYIDKNKICYKSLPFFKLVDCSHEGMVFYINEYLQHMLVSLQQNAGKEIAENHVVSYTKYPLRYHACLKGKYVLRIYELLSQYIYRQHVYIDIDYLRKILCLETKFSSYKEFKRCVLEPAKEEINNKTNITFAYDQIKRGKCVVKLEFHIFEKDENIELKNLYNTLLDFGITEDSASYLLNTINIETSVIKSNIEYVKESLKQNKKIHNVGSYLYAAICGDYAGKSLCDAQHATAKYIDRVKCLNKVVDLKAIRDLVVQYNEIANSKIDEFIQDKNLNDLMKEILDDNSSPFISDFISSHIDLKNLTIEDIVSHPLIYASVKRYVLNKVQNGTTDLIDFLKSNGEEVSELFLLQNGLI